MKIILTETQLNTVIKENFLEDAVRKEASKYKYKDDFRKANIDLYRVAVELGITNELFPERKMKWNKDTVTQEAQKYNSKTEFYLKNQAAYDAARKLGIIHDLFPERKPWSRKKFTPLQTILKQYNTENIQEWSKSELVKSITEQDARQYDAWSAFDEVRREAMWNFCGHILKHKKVHQDWRRAPFERINKIWTDYSKLGFVRDEKGIEMLEDMFVYNVALLDVSTIIGGHKTGESSEGFLKYEAELNPKQIKLIDDVTEEAWGDWDTYLVSDYGLEPLLELANQLLAIDNTPEEKLLTLDRMLGVAHMRSDLSKIFVEGGSASLDILFNQ